MGLPLLVLAKLKAVLRSSSFSPLVWSLTFPFLLKPLLRLGPGDGVCPWRFFILQLHPVASWNGSIWARAVRFVHDYLSDAARPQAPTIYGDDFLHTLSMLTL